MKIILPCPYCEFENVVHVVIPGKKIKYPKHVFQQKYRCSSCKSQNTIEGYVLVSFSVAERIEKKVSNEN